MSPGGTAMPSRWQIDVLVYEETSSYPVLLLQPGRPEDHCRLFGMLARAGLAVPTAREWERGFWPLAAGCRVELSEGSSAVIVHVGGHSLTVGLGSPSLRCPGCAPPVASSRCCSCSCHPALTRARS
ncbi:hypothetical protein [Amycolatopsis bullii]|uniref:Uncharacterized protein n=1 Tax=Amycolatopsis bullii TaxID=941987 RepID=A0ABQ3KX19_9PSEU|nr:hypothetical protein [Amycolatopsis bullii]GHG50791.1 hypothetical protein GCM10017567_87030 [Amycolatopsis bullii]